jgi:AraC family transcriptional regulator
VNYLQQVQKGIEFIEANLDGSFTAAQVARHSGISQWHFQRIFCALTNETLKTYIRSRRLAISLDKLLTTDDRIIDIALSAGYETQESFTRAFKKSFNITPNEYRKLGDKNLFLKKVQFDSDYLRHINTGITLEPKLITLKKLQLVGLKTNFYSVDSEKNNIADQLPPLWDTFLKQVNNIENRIDGIGYGVIQQTNEKTDHLEYYAAVEVSSLGYYPEDMECINIPTANYATFTHKGNVNKINNTVNYIYSSWLLQSDKQHSYAADLEIYDHRYIADSDDSIIEYAIPIL